MSGLTLLTVLSDKKNEHLKVLYLWFKAEWDWPYPFKLFTVLSSTSVWVTLASVQLKDKIGLKAQLIWPILSTSLLCTPDIFPGMRWTKDVLSPISW